MLALGLGGLGPLGAKPFDESLGFGYPALLVCRYKVPLYIGFVVREGGAHFRIECQRVALDLTGDNKVDIPAITTKINHIFSAWILEHPDQWLWTTRRW